MAKQVKKRPSFAEVLQLSHECPVLVTQVKDTLQAEFEHLLEIGGLRVIGTQDRQAALRLCQTEQISLVVCNAYHTKTAFDSIDLFQQLRASPETRHIRFLFTTSLRADALQTLVGNLVIDGYVRLPYDPDAVLEQTIRILQNVISEARASG